MKALEKAIQEAKGNARVIGKLLREACRVSPQAAELLEQDLAIPEMSLEKCADALRDYAKKHQSGGCWSCCVIGFEPDNEAVKVILDFYRIPPEWFSGGESAAAEPVPVPAGGRVDLMSLL